MVKKQNVQAEEKVTDSVKELVSVREIMFALMNDELLDIDRAYLQDKLCKSPDKQELMDVITNAVIDEIISDRYDSGRKPSIEEQNRFQIISELIKIREEQTRKIENKSKRLLQFRQAKVWRVAAVLIPFFVMLGAGIYFGWQKSNDVDNNIALVADNTFTVEAVEGVQKDVILSDSSKVWVNSGSKVIYPKTFKGNKREVFLEGEAYFDIASDKQKPFIVNTSELHVRVLGTKFNVDEEQGDYTRITLYEGSVEVTDGTNSKTLVPNQMLTYEHTTGTMTVENIAELRDWRSDTVQANDKTLSELFVMIGNYYDVEIVFANGEITDGEIFSIGFGKDLTVEKVIQSLSAISGEFDYRFESNKIIINKK